MFCLNLYKTNNIFLFIYFQKMPNTIITKAKWRDNCPLCEEEVQGNKFREHLLMFNLGQSMQDVW